MSIKNLWKDRKRPTISFEFFPARDEKADGKLDKAVDALAELEPDFVSVTFGAGGTTREGSFRLAQKLKKEKALEVLPYLAPYGLPPDAVTSILDDYKGLGIDALLCVRGDKPEIEDFKPHPAAFPHASDLLTFVGKHYDFFTGAAGYPEGHIDAESKEKDLHYLKLKVENGARFIIAQYVYDNQYFFDFEEKCRKIGIDVPILAAVMPIYSGKMTESLAALCGASITPPVREGLAKLPPGDKKAVTAFGIDFALRQCRELIKHGVDGIHFCTMDRAKSVTRIITQLKEEGLL
ncbi:MAG: 5,10-methylenetetrahydrofolate reductase [bacterium]|nr:5,10-methylenetetrahydrofolate reductase [bacterium]